MPALIRLLHRTGFAREDIYIESNPDSASAGSLVEQVIFEGSPARRVTVLVNMGLLGSGSPLPSYFARLIEQATDPEPFEDFIHYFDNILLRQMVDAVMPEDDTSLWGDRAQTKQSYFGMLGLNSVATLGQVFTWYFPDLGSLVRRHSFRRSTSAHAFRTGVSSLDGSGVVGRHYESDAEGFIVELFAEEEANSSGAAWPHVVRERLNDRVLPQLHGVRMPMTVALTVLSHESWVKLQHQGYLGYERVVAEQEGGHRMLIFSDFTGMAKPGKRADVHS